MEHLNDSFTVKVKMEILTGFADEAKSRYVTIDYKLYFTKDWVKPECSWEDDLDGIFDRVNEYATSQQVFVSEYEISNHDEMLVWVDKCFDKYFDE